MNRQTARVKGRDQQRVNRHEVETETAGKNNGTIPSRCFTHKGLNGVYTDIVSMCIVYALGPVNKQLGISVCALHVHFKRDTCGI